MQNKLYATILHAILFLFFVLNGTGFESYALAGGQEWCWTKMVDDPDASFEVPDIPRPEYLKTIIDPIFGTKITRITGDPGTRIITKSGENIGVWGDAVKYHYSKDQPWNANSSLIHLSRNDNGSPEDLFLDGDTYKVLFSRKVPGHDNRWHPTHPELKVYVDDNKLGYFNVQTGKQSIIRTFFDYTRINLGPWEGNLSYDGQMVAFYAEKANGQVDAFAYNITTNTTYSPLELNSSTIDWVSISASGQYVVINYSDTDSKTYDLNMNLVATFAENISHYDLGIDNEGDDAASGVKKPDGEGVLVKHNLHDGTATVLTPGLSGKIYGTHTSTRNFLLPGWSYSSFNVERPVYKDEVVAVKMDGSGKVRRFCQTHNNETDYVSEIQPVPSPAGKRVMFSSNWGEIDGRPVGTYVADARTPCTATRPDPPTGLRIVYDR